MRCKNENHRKDIIEAISEFHCLNFETSDWILYGDFLAELRKRGIKVPIPDSMIAYLALKNECKIVSNDRHLKMIQLIFPEMELFDKVESCAI